MYKKPEGLFRILSRILAKNYSKIPTGISFAHNKQLTSWMEEILLLKEGQKKIMNLG